MDVEWTVASLLKTCLVLHICRSVTSAHPKASEIQEFVAQKEHFENNKVRIRLSSVGAQSKQAQEHVCNLRLRGGHVSGDSSSAETTAGNEVVFQSAQVRYFDAVLLEDGPPAKRAASLLEKSLRSGSVTSTKRKLDNKAQHSEHDGEEKAQCAASFLDNAPQLASQWNAPSPLCEGEGSTWAFQMPGSWTHQISEHGFETHYLKWKNRNSGKIFHPLWFISGAPGIGKSRCLDNFPAILKEAATQLDSRSDSAELVERLDSMLVFKISFENGMGPGMDDLPSNRLIPARMAFQMRADRSETWQRFRDSTLAITITVMDVIRHLVKISHVQDSRELTLLLLVDGVHKIQKPAFDTVLAQLCDQCSSQEVFCMAAVSSTIQQPVKKFLSDSQHPSVQLIPSPINGSFILGDLKGHPMKEILVSDMGGHGRALELLQKIILRNPQRSATAIMGDVKSGLDTLYANWNFLPSDARMPVLAVILTGKPMHRMDIVPGTDLTVDFVSSNGLIRHEADSGRLVCAYVWVWLLCDKYPSPLFDKLRFHDYAALEDVLNDGQSSTLSYRYFEELCCAVRAIRSYAFPENEPISWQEFHAGAVFGDGCDETFINKRLPKILVASEQFSTKSEEDADVILRVHRKIKASCESAVFLNAAGAPSGDAMVPLRRLDHSHFNEIHQDKLRMLKKIMAALKKRDLLQEFEKAASAQDLLILYCSGLAEKAEIPARIALLSTDKFEGYFGPFAGRAFAFSRSLPINVNSATRYQLLLCKGVGDAYAEKILANRQFRSSEEFRQKIRNFSEQEMSQFSFD